jgi:uncharacterized protein involved in exopolysaccharide biosynthesis
VQQQIEAYPAHAEADSFDFRTTWLAIVQAVRGHKMLIALTAGFTVFFVILYILIWPPVYSSSVTLVAEPDRDATRDDFYQTWNVFRKDKLSDSVYLVTAKPLMEEVVQKLDLRDKDVYHTFFAYLTKLWTTSWPGKAYKWTKDLILGKKKGPYVLTQAQIDYAQTIHNFSSGVKLQTMSDSNVGKLVVLGPSPRVAEMANTLADAFLEQRRQGYQLEAQRAYDALAEESNKASAELTALERRMATAMRDNGIDPAFEKDKLDVGQWGAIRGSLVEHQTAIANGEATIAALNRELAKEPPEIPTARLVKPSNGHDSLTDRLSQLELQRKQLLIHYKPDAPEIQDIDREIAVSRQQLAVEPQVTEQSHQMIANETYQQLKLRKRQLEADVAGHRAAAAIQEKQLAQYQATMAQIPGRMELAHAFDREHSELEKRYVTLQDKMQIAEVSRAAAASAPGSIRIVERASVPEKPGWPNIKLLIPCAALVGLAIGVVLALLVDLMNGRLTRFRFMSNIDQFGSYAVLVHDSKSAVRLFPPRNAALEQDGKSRR